METVERLPPEPYAFSEGNPFHLIERHIITAPIVEPCRARTFMDGHSLRNLQLAAILQIGRSRSLESCALIFVRRPARFLEGVAIREGVKNVAPEIRQKLDKAISQEA